MILATASNQKFAHAVAQYLGLFDRVLASDEQTNLSGHRKRDQLLADYGDNGFAYAGNARIDLEIWSHADEGTIVDATSSVSHLRVDKTLLPLVTLPKGDENPSMAKKRVDIFASGRRTSIF